MSLIAAIVAFSPFSPGMPSGGLDPSWVFALNQAVAQGFTFGDDIIFTFGPYASIYSKAYYPSTDFMMVSGSLYLALSYWAYFLFLMKGVQRFWSLVFCALLAGFVFTQDPLFFSLPLLVGLVSAKIIFSLEGELLPKSKLTPFYMVLLFAPLGLLPLIKGSMLVLSGGVVALCAIFFAVSKQRLLAVICIGSPVVSMYVFWIASGQSAAALPNYFINLAPILSGYTEAMATEGKITEVVVYLIASALLLLPILTQKQLTNASKFFLFGIYFAFLFVAFKAGFVRHDGHAVIAGTSLLFAAMLLPFVLKTRIIFPVVIFAMVSGYYINNHYVNMSAESIANGFKSTYSSAWHGVENRIIDGNRLQQNFDVAVNSLRQQASFPVLQGTTDIYSFNQSYLIASGNTWSPRPVFQSFAAYTPALAEANRNHLLGKQAPDNIIFKVESIDGRFPSMDDGASWPVLMYKYRPIRMENGYLFLRKREEIGEMVEPLKLTREKHKFGESISLPDSSRPIFVQMEIEPTVIGRLASIFYKSSHLAITLVNNNGMKSKNRIISGMAKSGFLISPHIENVTEFSLLYGKIGLLNDKKVKSMEVTSSDGTNWLWKDEYWVTFSQIETVPPVNLSSITTFDGFEDKFSGLKVATAKKCDGNVDSINGASFVPGELSASSLLNVNGWLANSVEKGTLPEAVYVTLTDKQGKYLYIRTRRTPRPDVGEHFKRPTLNESGYSTLVDISATSRGQYSLGIAVEESGRIEICPNINIPIKITK